jgi:hypothetical protein
MPTLHLVASHSPARLFALNVRVRRVARSAAARVLMILRSLWSEVFSTSPFDRPPGTPSPIMKATALREPALLSEKTDAVAKRKVAR